MSRKHTRAFSEMQKEDSFMYIGTPHIEIESNKSATVEGCKGIIEYDCDIVRINCGNIIVKFTGSCLELEALSTDRISVKGSIISVEFCT